jgi:hypothetical protein
MRQKNYGEDRRFSGPMRFTLSINFKDQLAGAQCSTSSGSLKKQGELLSLSQAMDIAPPFIGSERGAHEGSSDWKGILSS